MKLWSHEVAQSLASSSAAEGALARELLSHRYSARALIVLPLHSGEIAIFDSARQLRGIAEPAELAEALRRISAEEASQAAAARQRAALASRISGIEGKSLADLGL